MLWKTKQTHGAIWTDPQTNIEGMRIKNDTLKNHRNKRYSNLLPTYNQQYKLGAKRTNICIQCLYQNTNTPLHSRVEVWKHDKWTPAKIIKQTRNTVTILVNDRHEEVPRYLIRAGHVHKHTHDHLTQTYDELHSDPLSQSKQRRDYNQSPKCQHCKGLYHTITYKHPRECTQCKTNTKSFLQCKRATLLLCCLGI